jgi:hypothetical protein
MTGTQVPSAKALSTKVPSDSGAGPSGPFIQFSGGPVIFARGEKNITMPSDTVRLSAGFSLGWRFLLGTYFFIEPAIRAGYPYIAGVGLSAGVRF